MLGLFELEFEPWQYLTPEQMTEVILPITSRNSLDDGYVRYPGSNTTLPKAEVFFQLSDQHYFFERTPYTILTLIGDLGGFQGAIVLLPSFLMSFYSAKMFEASVAAKMPVRKRSHSTLHPNKRAEVLLRAQTLGLGQ